MHRRRKRTPGLAQMLALVCLAATANSDAQDRAAAAVTLAQAFEAAWARQPEALALQLRREAVHAQQQAALAWTPEPAALTLSDKTDRFNRNQGVREIEVGLAIPLWLPGERARSGALAEAERGGVESRLAAARLRLAGGLREAWWQQQRAQVDADVARDQLTNARVLAADVAKRLRAGDLARADQHQADGAVAAAESAVARALSAEAAARQQLRATSGGVLEAPANARAEPEPAGGALASEHPAVAQLQDRVTIAERAAALGTTRARANPELTLATTRERDGRGERYEPSITIGLRIPLGAGSRYTARVAAAQAEATELQAQLRLERERIAAEQDALRERMAAARAQLAAAERRAQLAAESRGFFDKSFRVGETDLPTRLRVEAEAVEARRQAASARIEVAAAISQWRQALGLLPE